MAASFNRRQQLRRRKLAVGKCCLVLTVAFWTQEDTHEEYLDQAEPEVGQPEACPIPRKGHKLRTPQPREPLQEGRKGPYHPSPTAMERPMNPYPYHPCHPPQDRQHPHLRPAQKRTLARALTRVETEPPQPSGSPRGACGSSRQARSNNPRNGQGTSDVGGEVWRIHVICVTW